jgi:predicted HAD superfamily Cof-like phosphohydrolase
MPKTVTPAEMLVEFHTKFRCSMRTTPGLIDVSPELLKLRGDLLAEEAEEYVEAARLGDRVGVADGLADVTYVAWGNALTYGIDLEAALRNSRVLPSFLSGVRVYAEAAAAEDLDQIAVALAATVFGARLIANAWGIDLDACLAEVHRSNMTKLGVDGEPIFREDGKILKGPNYERPNLAAIVEVEVAS